MAVFIPADNLAAGVTANCMTMKLCDIIKLVLLTVIPFNSIGQTAREYDKEEAIVINRFFNELIDAKRLNNFNKSDSSLVVFFETRLVCNLDREPFFIGKYKPNETLEKLESNNLGERKIDSLEIRTFDKIKIVFVEKSNYSLEKYESKNVIGTFNISRISFNNKMNVGYFYYSVYCGEDCGWGGLVKIVKKNERWVVADYLCSYIN